MQGGAFFHKATCKSFAIKTIELHLLFAGFMAPVFILLAASGGLYLIGNKGEFKAAPIELPAQASLDFNSPTLEADVRSFLYGPRAAHILSLFKRRRG